MNGKKYPRYWEEINPSLERLKVPGGWIVHATTTVIVQDRTFTASESLVYVEDEEFEWHLEP